MHGEGGGGGWVNKPFFSTLIEDIFGKTYAVSL